MENNKIKEKKYIEIIEQMFEIDTAKTIKILEYVDLVLEKNEFINLTAVKNREEAFEKHIIDSLSVLNIDEYKKSQRVLDVGTGAGFPGVILAIASPEKEFVLLDSTLKKLRVIDEFVNILAIDNVKTIHSRAEQLLEKSDFNSSFDLVVSRAVANLKTLVGWTLPFLKSEGMFLAYKGENYKQELKEAERVIKQYGGEIKEIYKNNESTKMIGGHVVLGIRKK